MKQKTTNRLKINLLCLAIAMLVSSIAMGQKFMVDDVEFRLDKPEPDLEICKTNIDKAAEHPKTSGSAKMFYYRGLVYLKLATVHDSLLVKYPDALEIARQSFLRCLELDTKEKYASEAKNNGLVYVAMGLYNQGYNAYDNGEYDKAIDILNKAIPLLQYDEKEVLKQNNLNENVLVQLIAYSAIGKKDDDLAIKSFQRLIDNGFHDPNVYGGLAQLHLGQGDTIKALEIISSGREMFEENRILINLELDIFLKQGRSAELIDKLDVAIEEDPGNVIYYFARAISYEGLASSIRKETDKFYKIKNGMESKEVLEILGNPKSESTAAGVKTMIYEYGSVLINVSSGRVNKATASEKAIGQIKDYLDKALSDYDKIIEINPSYYDAYYNKGAMYQNQVSAIVDEINAKGIYDPKEVAKYTEKTNALYREAIKNFEIVFENHTEMTPEDRIELAKNMKRVYAQLGDMEKFAEMKHWIESHEK